MARQGWEPATPIRLQYKAWSQTDLGEVDLEEWVMTNAEIVELAREKSMTAKMKAADKTKKQLDDKAKERQFEVGDEVLV